MSIGSMSLITAALLLLAPARANLLDMGVTSAGGGGGGPYVGPGDIVSGAIVWYGLRAYTAAYATAHNKLANICNSAGSGGACFDVTSDSSGNLNLASAPSLTCNNTTNLCTIQTLYDQSAMFNCGGVPCDVSNATVANRPILVVPGGCPSPVTSKFCMSTTGGGAQSLTAPADFGSGGPEPYTVSLVYQKVPPRTGDEYLFNSQNLAAPTIVADYSNTNFLLMGNGNGGGSPTLTAADGTYHAAQLLFNGASSSGMVDGTTTAVTMVGTAITTARINMLSIMGPTGGTNGFGGISMEFGLWLVGLTTPQQTTMNSNQHTYWGF